MNKRSIGIIGGMGPKADLTFLENIRDKTEASCDNEHIEAYLFSNTKVPDRTEAINNGEFNTVLDELLKSVRGLEMMGVSNIVITCNGAHYWLSA